MSEDKHKIVKIGVVTGEAWEARDKNEHILVTKDWYCVYRNERLATRVNREYIVFIDYELI